MADFKEDQKGSQNDENREYARRLVTAVNKEVKSKTKHWFLKCCKFRRVIPNTLNCVLDFLRSNSGISTRRKH